MLVKFKSNGNNVLENADMQQQQDPGCEEVEVSITASTFPGKNLNIFHKFLMTILDLFSRSCDKWCCFNW